MAAKNVILALLALTSFAYGQTRALFVNTNGTVQWGNTLRFDGPLDFTTNTQAATTRSNLSLGLPALTNTSNAGLLLALGALATNGSASALTNFPALLLTTNSSASAFPAALLRTNGDGSGLTNLPNANLSNAVGVLPLSNGGTGATNASAARTALQLGSAATNDASAFQTANTNLTALAAGDGSNLTNVTVTDASSLTNFPSLLLRTNGSAAGLTNFPSQLLRTNGDGSGLTNVSVDLTTVLPSYSNNAGKVLAVAAGSTNVEWIAVSNTVTDASTLTNFPASILQTNSADGSFPAFLLRTNGSAAGLTSFPTLNQNTTGTASNVTGVVAIANGGSGQTTAAAAIEAFLPAYSGNADKILALNSNATGLVWTTNAGGGGGIVNLADTTNGVTNTLGIANGGTGASDVTNARINLLPSYTGNSNKVLALNSNATAVIWTNAAGGGLPETPLAISNGGTGTNTAAGARAALIVIDDGGVALGGSVSNVTGGSYAGVALGKSANNQTYGGAAIGQSASVTGNVLYGGSAVGRSASSTDGGGSIGYDADTAGGGAIGHEADSVNGFAGGYYAKATTNNASQIGTGTNTSNNTIQFMSAGTVDTNEWSYLANASVKGGSRMTNTNGVTVTNTIIGYDGTNYTTNTITVIDGIITSWTQ